MSVSPTKTQAIQQMSRSAQANQLAEDGAFVIRMLEMAHVLARGETVSTAELKKYREEQTVVGEKLLGWRSL